MIKAKGGLRTDHLFIRNCVGALRQKEYKDFWVDMIKVRMTVGYLPCQRVAQRKEEAVEGVGREE